MRYLPIIEDYQVAFHPLKKTTLDQKRCSEDQPECTYLVGIHQPLVILRYLMRDLLFQLRHLMKVQVGLILAAVILNGPSHIAQMKTENLKVCSPKNHKMLRGYSVALPTHSRLDAYESTAGFRIPARRRLS